MPSFKDVVESCNQVIWKASVTRQIPVSARYMTEKEWVLFMNDHHSYSAKPTYLFIGEMDDWRDLHDTDSVACPLDACLDDKLYYLRQIEKLTIVLWRFEQHFKALDLSVERLFQLYVLLAQFAAAMNAELIIIVEDSNASDR